MKKFRNYFQDKKVFITGHTGFKGSWLTNWLLNLESNIIGFSNEIPTNPSMFETLDLKNQIIDIRGDLRNYTVLSEAIIENKPDIIIHLAAQPLVRKSYIDPVETYTTNIMGTVNLFESIRKIKNRSKDKEIIILNVTSDKCYENKEKNYRYKESDSLGGYDPYSSSKACSEIITAAYRRSFFNMSFNSKISISTARAGNIIGGGDWSEDRLVVDCINSLATGEKIVLRNPKAIRPWQHVLDGISGYMELVCHMIENKHQYNQKYDKYKNKNNYKNNISTDENNASYSNSWNFGPYPENVANVEYLVKEIISNWGSGHYSIESDNNFHEANLLELDISKSLKNLEWQPKLNFKESIKITIDWYKEFYHNQGDMITFTNRQIKDYIKK